MIIGAATIKLYAPWVHSLKEKRMTVKSILSKTRNKFNVSAAEIDQQDTHQIIVLGIACVTNNAVFAYGTLDKAIAFVEENTDAEVLDIQREIR